MMILPLIFVFVMPKMMSLADPEAQKVSMIFLVAFRKTFWTEIMAIRGELKHMRP